MRRIALCWCREESRRHYLAALDEAMFVRTIVGDRLVDGTQVIPNQHVTRLPAKYVAILVLALVSEQAFQQSIAFSLGQFVDAHGVAGIGIQRFATRDRMGQDDA